VDESKIGNSGYKKIWGRPEEIEEVGIDMIKN